MFERFVFIKLNSQWSDAAGKKTVLAEIERVLPTIPGVLSCRAGQPVTEGAAKGWDLCIVMHFSSADDIETYRVHPVHQDFLNSFLEPKVEAKRAWNFETTSFETTSSKNKVLGTDSSAQA